MRHEHERANSQDAEFLAGIPTHDAATYGNISNVGNRGNTRMPAARDANQKLELETDTVLALTRTLVAPLPPRSALLRALSLGSRLLPCMRALSLYTMPDGTRGSLMLAGIVERRIDGTEDTEGIELAAHDVWQPRMTLGHGNKLDRRALVEHATCRVGGIIAIPLLSPELGVAGVLVAEERDSAHARERHPRLDMLAHCLSVLLERHLRDEAASRRARALATLGALAAHTPASGTAPDANAGMRERDALLSAAADALHELAQPLASIALAPALDGALRVAGAAEDDVVQLNPVRGAELLAALHEQVALDVSARHESGIWADLAALREWVREGTGRHVERITLLPVWVEGEVAGVLTLAHAQSDLDVRRWMPAATAIAIAAGAGIRALRLAEVAAEEGRARDAFISLAAHELRSPLTAIKGYAQLFARQARKTTVSNSMLQSVRAIEQQSMRMSEMIGELLDASRIRRGVLQVQLATCDLVPLAQTVIEKRRPNYPRHTIVLHLEAPSLVGTWDTTRVEQILRDLLDNAARYSPEGGAISIRLANVEGMALVSARDAGIGIAPQDQERIFEYLYRVPGAEARNLSGLGLGLYICRHLAERMGGRLTLHETSTGETHGSEFRMLLPLA